MTVKTPSPVPTSKALVLLVLASLAVVTLAGCPKRDMRTSLLQEKQAPDKSTTVLAVYEPWFGDPDHLNVGYSTQDVVVLQKQVTQAKGLGITGFVVDWYGHKKPFEDKSYELLQGVAGQNGFQTALMYDEIVNSPDHMTEDAIAAMDYAYFHYIGAGAKNNSAYLRYQVRPVIFIWPKGGKTDWKRVRDHVNSWPDPPLLIYKDEPSPFAENFDGFYAWIHPGPAGWKPDGSEWGADYLETFYHKMVSQHPDKITVGAAWAGFDDKRASWSENRYMDSRCGKTFDDTLRSFRRYHGADNPLPFLLIATWNDYEEGTAIERG